MKKFFVNTFSRASAGGGGGGTSAPQPASSSSRTTITNCAATATARRGSDEDYDYDEEQQQHHHQNRSIGNGASGGVGTASSTTTATAASSTSCSGGSTSGGAFLLTAAPETTTTGGSSRRSTVSSSTAASGSNTTTDKQRRQGGRGAAAAAASPPPPSLSSLGQLAAAASSTVKITSGGRQKQQKQQQSSKSPNRHKSTTITISVGDKMFSIEEIERLLREKDEIIKKQDYELKLRLARIEELEAAVRSLQSECDKLRSVLKHKTSSADLVYGGGSGGVPASPRSPQPRNTPSSMMVSSPSPVVPTAAGKNKSSDDLRAELQTDANMRGQQANWAKKQGVSAEPDIYRTEKIKLIHHKKSADSKQLIRDAVMQNDFLRHLDKDQVTEMVECMYEREMVAGEYVILEGEAGAHLYVAAEGELEVSKGDQILGRMGSGKVFGELAILYNCTRTASVRALTPVRLWVLDRAVFQMITMRLGLQKHETVMQFLREVPIFKNLSDDRISKIADTLDLDYYTGGTFIIREGEKGDMFFIISNGEVKVVQLVDGFDEPQEIRVLHRGDFFGEKALLGDDLRTASVVAMPPGVEVLTLDRESFQKLIGDLKELQRDYGDERRGAKRLGKRISGRESTEISVEVSPGLAKVPYDKEFEGVELHHLKPIATLGVGGFGRVEMVMLINDRTRAFALKAMKKKHIVDTRQQEHIFAERNIMYEMRSPYITRLYKTFRDRKYVYMLLECCLGGELWTILRDRGHFDDMTARFYVACVVEALEYLHKCGVIYRDLKPENCLLDATGYLKLVDFGFAKKLGSGRKTWTFCGTPEYVAPEIILNKGHDHSADYWALGIYICELLLGRPPFQASDPMKTYTLILKGVDALDIPNRRINKTATTLIKKLCRDNPAERLGCQSGGIDDIRKHRWFLGFDWDGLRARGVKPPIVPKVSSPTDVSNFDHYPPDHDIPTDEFSGWDEGF